jgi:hypothetical protein
MIHCRRILMLTDKQNIAKFLQQRQELISS